MSDFLNGLLNWFSSLWSDLGNFFVRLFINLLDLLFDGVVSALSYIPMPEFMTDFTIGSLMGPVEPHIGYFLAQSGVGIALSIMGSAYVAAFLKNMIPIIGR